MAEIASPTLRKIPLLDLKPQFQSIREEVLDAVHRVIESQQLILGEEVERFERDAAAYCGARHAVGCASGSDALLLALRALNIGRGDLVLTTPYTFFATAGSIVHAGATPVFADVEAATFNLDAESVARTLDARQAQVKAIIAVDLFGGCADYDRLKEIAAASGIPIIEDAAQAIGAEYRGRRAGSSSLGAIGCFSFFPSKNLGAFGDGGLLTTDDDALARRLRSLRNHGSARKYYYDEIGYNSRLDALQAAVLRVKLPYLDAWTEGRQRNADRYRAAFRQRGAGVPEQLILPEPPPYQTRHIYNQFVIRSPRRDQLREYLAEGGISSEVYYPVPLHLQRCFAQLGYRPGDLPVSEALAADSLALPVHPDLGTAELERVAATVLDFLRLC